MPRRARQDAGRFDVLVPMKNLCMGFADPGELPLACPGNDASTAHRSEAKTGRMRGRTGRARFGLLGVALGLFARSTPAAEVEWRGPNVCPDAAELRFRVERSIGMPLSHAAPLRFEVTAARSAQGFTALVATDPGAGGGARERTLAAPDCSRLADLVAVTLALALGADAGAAADAGAGLTSAELAATPMPESGAHPSTAAQMAAQVVAPAAVAGADAVPRAPDEAASSRWRPGLSVWLVGDSGSLPEPGVGAALGAEFGNSMLELRALGTWFMQQHQELGGLAEPRPGADLGLVLGALSGCAALWGSFVADGAAYACGGWELGRLSGTGTDVLRPREGAALWSAPRLDVGARWALGSDGFELGALLTLAVPLVRKDFVLGELGPLHRPPAAVARAGIGINWSWR
jgi:hypothetical protein